MELKIKKLKAIDYTSTTGELKAILKICIPTTLSHLVGNFTYFLEPIVYVWILTILNFQQSQIEESYTIVNAFTISLTQFIHTSGLFFLPNSVPNFCNKPSS